MSNSHEFDRSTQMASIRVDMKRWADGYWQLDYRLTEIDKVDSSFCVPLFSGRRSVTQAEREEIIHLCALGVVALTTLDFDETPF